MGLRGGVIWRMVSVDWGHRAKVNIPGDPARVGMQHYTSRRKYPPPLLLSPQSWWPSSSVTQSDHHAMKYDDRSMTHTRQISPSHLFSKTEGTISPVLPLSLFPVSSLCTTTCPRPLWAQSQAFWLVESKIQPSHWLSCMHSVFWLAPLKPETLSTNHIFEGIWTTCMVIIYQIFVDNNRVYKYHHNLFTNVVAKQ